MNEMVAFRPNATELSSRFASVPKSNDLAAGVQAGFGIIGYKGKAWSYRYRGENVTLMRDDGDGPRNSIDVVILKASTVVSKIFYKAGYVEGSTDAPDCYSTNGVVPDNGSKEKQHDVCATCPMNAWGSRTTPAGKQGKRCGDSKRIAIAPLADLRNEVYGGAMLLRVPAASLNDLAQLGNKLEKMGYPYYSVATRISFDPSESYPKFQLQAIRPLTDEEADTVIDMRDDAQVTRILSEDVGGDTPAPVAAKPKTESVFLETGDHKPPAAVRPAPAAAAPAPDKAAEAPKPASKPVPVQAAPVQAAPVAEADDSASTGTSFDDALDAELDALLPAK